MLGHYMNLKRCLTTTRGDGSSREGGVDLARWECSVSEGLDIETLRAAYRVAKQYVEREASREIVANALYALKMRTASRKEDAADIESRVLALTPELTRYPPDVVVEGLKDIARNQSFFPTLAEIIRTLDRFMDKRRSILTAIEIAGRNASKPKDAEGRNEELDDLRSDPCWVEWMRQVNDNPLTVKPWEQFRREWG